MRKKPTTTNPLKYTVKDSHFSPRNTPQQVIISDTSLGNNIEEQVQTAHRQTAKFYSPEYRGTQITKNKSPNGQLSIYCRNRNSAKEKRLSSAQQQALAELQKAKQNVVKSTTNNV